MGAVNAAVQLEGTAATVAQVSAALGPGGDRSEAVDSVGHHGRRRFDVRTARRMTPSTVRRLFCGVSHKDQRVQLNIPTSRISAVSVVWLHKKSN